MEKKQTSEINTSPLRFIIRMFLIILYMAVILGALLFTAGTFAWPEAYVFMGGYALFFIVFYSWGILKAPELMKERTSRKKDMKPWDNLIVRFLYTPLLISLLVLSALDYGRLKFPHVPLPVKLAAGGMALIAGVLIFRVFLTNRFASGIVRIQTERGHEVISSGPYRIVRHPMYLGIIFMIPSIPLILGSFLGLIPAGLIVILFFIRTYLEDMTLQKELPGYIDFTKKTRKRLIPFIW